MAKRVGTNGQPRSEDLAHIIEPLRPFAQHVDTLHYDPENTRQHNEQNSDATESSLRMYGQQLPLLHMPDTRIMKVGNNRLRLAREVIGWKWVASIPTNLAGLDSDAFALLENRSGELATWIWERLGQKLTEIAKRGDDLVHFGFTPEQAAAVKVDWSLLSTTSKDGEAEYAEKLVLVMSDVSLRADLTAAIQKLLVSKKWDNSVKIA